MDSELRELRLAHPRPEPLMALGQKLRRHHPSERAIWLMQQLEMYWDALRLQAFRQPLELYFEAQALQMGSRWPLAERRALELAARFPTLRLVEIGAGIGGDTLELARTRAFRTIEQDESRRSYLQHNLEACGFTEVEVQGGDGLTRLDGAQLLYADPARRNAKGRQWHDLAPDPAELWKLGLPLCLKLSPGLDESQLPSGCDLDYVSHQGVCKEATVWTPGSGRVRAFLYRDPDWLVAERRETPPVAPLEPGMWLHEPDPAAIRAQLWQPLEGWRIDETLALLATEPGLRSEWTQTFEVLEIADGDRKNLIRLQKHYDFQPLEIKKRGFDVEPEELRKKLPRGTSGGAGVLYLTRVAGRHRALICKRV
ncbi:MAG: hypothetical protein J0I12_24270 [Candidatus Eremiobacteraeota bacterium]|nr:hypothetical protein [Candidatus Eremiobacteraeota bacterium]